MDWFNNLFIKNADAVKIAKANKTKEAKLAASIPATKVTKSSNVNGVKFTIKPVSGTITSRFGRRSSPGGIGSTNHKGLDIAANTGTTIVSSHDGEIIEAEMREAARNLEFERAMELRDILFELKSQ